MSVYDTDNTPYTPRNGKDSIKIPPSIAAYNKYGIHTSDLKKLVTHLFHYPDACRDCLQRYYLLYWTPGYAIEKITNGVILRDGYVYTVIYMSINPTDLLKHQQIKLSFRLPKIEYIKAGIMPTVIIAPVTTKEYKGENNG